MLEAKTGMLRITLRGVAFALTVSTGPLMAQLVVGVDGASNPNAWHVEVPGAAGTALWDSVPVAAMAADDETGVVYAAFGSTLFAWSYNSGEPVELGVVREKRGASFPVDLAGLAVGDDGALFGSRVHGDPAGIFEIDNSNLAATLVLVTNPNDHEFLGLAYNADDGLFYAANEHASPAKRGLYSLDVAGTGAIVRITPYPPGVESVDGCALNAGKIYLVQDDPSPIFVFDLATMTYDATTLPSPVQSTRAVAGAAWAPHLKPTTPAVVYCTAKTTACGSLPSIGAQGVPSASNRYPFEVVALGTKGLKPGVLLYTDSGRGSFPFQGGTLCLTTTNLRRAAPVVDQTGTAGLCNGFLSVDMNKFAQGQLGGNPLPSLLVPCTQVNCQWWGRDTPANGSLLTDGLEYFIGL